MSIDVEDGINIAMRDYFNIHMQPTSRVLLNMNKILKLFEINKVKGTFFILGEVVEKYPDLVKQIDAAGHEVGVHGYYHNQIFRLTPQLLRDELTRTKDLIENITGKKVCGFRAPAFSISPETAWALHVIAECGFKYDSSIYPSKLRRYGWNDFPRQISKINLGNSTSLFEVPLSVMNIMGRNFPVCGGGYLRYLPYFLTRRIFLSISKKNPVIVYLHPYELDTVKYPDYFYEARAKSSLKQKLPLLFYRYKKGTVMEKLDRLTKEFRFIPLNEIIIKMEEAGNISEIRI